MGGGKLRIKCVLETDCLPVAYNMMFVSLIKECLKKIDENYFNRLFYYQGKHNKKSKNYSFAVGLKNFELDNEVFKINDSIIFSLSSPDLEFFINFYNGLLRTDIFNYKGYTLRRKRIVHVKEKYITQQEAVFKTLSPICLKDAEGRFLDLEDEKYSRELGYLADIILKNFRGYGLKNEIYFEPINMTKVVVKLDRQLENGEYYKVNAYRGIFKLKGDVEDLNLLYQLGLSFRRGQGFGMLEVI